MSMHADLQLRSQRRHPVHLLVSRRIFSHEKRDRMPSRVPTGHTVLQYVRPPRHAMTAIMTNDTAATPNVAHERTHTSRS